MGGIVASIGEELGLVAPEGVGASSAAQARSLEERAVRELEKLDIPPMEAQRLVLERPELVAQLIPEILQDTELTDIEISPGLKSAQLQALEATQELGEAGGFTPETMARFEALRRQTEGDEAARQASIMQSMAERGQLGEGAELAARLSSSQAATQRGSDISRDMLLAAPTARLQALREAGGMAGQLRGQEYGEASRAAEAQDVINRFNVGMRQQAQQYNVGEQQRLSEERTRLANEEERQRAGLYGQQFQQQLAKATGVTGQLGELAKGYQTQAEAEATAAQQRAAATRGLVVGGTQAAFGKPATAAAENGGVKRNNDFYADGGVERGMNYEGGGNGTIIDSGTNSFVGDNLPDRINENEMVINLDQQNYIKDLIKKLARSDHQVQMGEAKVNEDAQDELMQLARGQIAPQEMSDKPIVEKRERTKVDALNDLLDALRK